MKSIFNRAAICLIIITYPLIGVAEPGPYSISSNSNSSTASSSSVSSSSSSSSNTSNTCSNVSISASASSYSVVSSAVASVAPVAEKLGTANELDTANDKTKKEKSEIQTEEWTIEFPRNKNSDNVLTTYADMIRAKVKNKIGYFYIFELLKNAWDSTIEKHLQPKNIKVRFQRVENDVKSFEIIDQGTGFSEIKDTEVHSIEHLLSLYKNPENRKLRPKKWKRSLKERSDIKYPIYGGDGVGLSFTKKDFTDNEGSIHFQNLPNQEGARVIVTFSR